MDSWEKERAEQEAADQAEEERVARQEKRDLEEFEARMQGIVPVNYVPLDNLPPWLFADERSQRRTEAMAREEGPWDDYSPWRNEQLFR